MKRVWMLGILMVAGCRTMESVKGDTDGGTIKSYQGSVADLLAKSEQVFKDHGAATIEREGGAVFASFASNAAHDGTFCGVWVTEEKPGVVRVRCVTKNRSPHIIACALSERAFHELLSKETSK